MRINDVGSERSERARPQELPCPECGVVVPVHAGYVTWCDGCGWNLKPEVVASSRNLFEEIYLKLSRRSGDALFERMLREESLAPRLTFARGVAAVIAGGVHAVTLIFLLTGIALIVFGWPNIVAILGGVLAICIAIVARPRIPPAPDHGLISRDEFPALYKLADDVADALGARRIDQIVVNTEFNAAFSRSGWRRRRYLYIGLPLFSIHSDAERVALLGHEIGHSVNGDSGRLFFVRSAIDTLVVWYELIRPHSLLSSESGMPGIVMLPVNLLLYGVAGGIRGWIVLLVHLLHRDSQRGEYLADYLSAVVGGGDAAVTSTQLLYRAPLYSYTVQRVANNGELRLFEELHHQMEVLPERELERIRRVSLLPGSRIDTTHPPTPYRIRFLEERFDGEPKVVISPEDSLRLERELAVLQPQMEKMILEEYHDSLYW